MKRSLLTFSAWIFAASLALAASSDWPGWLGPNRDGKSPDQGLLKQWPQDGPKLLWKIDTVGPGFASVSVVGETIYSAGDGGAAPGAKKPAADAKKKSDGDGKKPAADAKKPKKPADEGGKDLMLMALDLDGHLKWKAAVGPAGPSGSRSTPTVDGDRVYVLTPKGVLGCFDAATGKKHWTRSAEEFEGTTGPWKYAESALIDGDRCIFKPGGKNCIVALNKFTGETLWKSSGFEAKPEYGSCIRVVFEGRPMIVTGTGQGLLAVDPESGKLLWKNDFSANNTANCPTPAYADGYIFWANGYGKGGVCVKLVKQGDDVTAEQAWTTKDMVCHHGGYVIDKGYIYGNHSNGWTCLELATGKKMWEAKGVGKGSLCFADGMLYLFAEKEGHAALATCSPEGLQLKGEVKVDGSGPSWAHPIVVGGRMYLRFDKNLYCYDVKQ